MPASPHRLWLDLLCCALLALAPASALAEQGGAGSPARSVEHKNEQAPIVRVPLEPGGRKRTVHVVEHKIDGRVGFFGKVARLRTR